MTEGEGISDVGFGISDLIYLLLSSGVAGLARVQTLASCLNSGEFSYRQDSWPHPSARSQAASLPASAGWNKIPPDLPGSVTVAQQVLVLFV